MILQVQSVRDFLRKNIDLILWGALFVSALVVALTPAYREQLQKLFSSEKKIVLSTVSGRVMEGGPNFVVTKVRYRSKLWAEVYKMDPQTGATQFWQSLPLESDQDAYLGFNVKSSNLALLDIDHDNILEIVAPTFDDQQNPKLNVFKYDPRSGLFR